MSSRTVLSLLVLGVVLPACTADFENEGAADVGVDAQSLPRFTGLGIGETCASGDECRSGLTCQGGRCQPAGTGEEVDKCLLTAECAPGFNCSWAGFCAPAGEGDVGDACTSASDCQEGLFCRTRGLVGFCEAPTPDARDLYEPCTDTADCLAGLTCSVGSGVCEAGSLLLNPDLFGGEGCAPAEEALLPFGVRMKVPREGHASDFYSLPFPNDAHIIDGSVRLEGHPTPGAGVLGFDPIQAVVDAVGEEFSGFSIEPAVYLRFTRPVDETSLRSEGDGATVHFIDLDHGTAHPFELRFVAPRNKYICSNHLYVHPIWSRPLAANTTYAVIVTRGVRAVSTEEGIGGPQPLPLDDLELLLGDTEPSDPDRLRAWQAYAKLRSWLASGGVLGADDVAGAAVFTTMDPTQGMRQIAAAAAEAQSPVIADEPLTLCEQGTVDVCVTPDWASTPEGVAGEIDPRACPSTPALRQHELHTRIRIPVYQEGERPYEETGGAVRFADGKAVIVGYESVCAAISIPNIEGVEMPAGGWPLVIFGHGTGGDFRSAMGARSLGLAELGVALLAIDQPMHGPRRNDDGDPGPLFYNYANPLGAKGNVYQGAADNYSLLRYATELDATVAGVGRVKFDPSRVVYAGHSQGSTTGVLYAAHAPGLKGALFTGLGGSLVYGLLGKKMPYDASIGLRLAIQEVEIDAYHPILNLLQYYFDETDALAHAHLFLREPVAEPVSVLNVFGWDDSFTPWRTGAIFAAILGGAYSAPSGQPPTLDTAGMEEVLADLDALDTALPVSGNVTVGDTTVTGASLSASSDGTYDGHFVGLQNEEIVRRTAVFLDTLLKTGTGTVPQ